MEPRAPRGHERGTAPRAARPDIAVAEGSTLPLSALAPATDAPRDGPSFIYSDEGLLHLSDLGAEALRVVESPLFECAACERLVETQSHEGAPVPPRFCPWCGRPVRSVLGREIDGYRIEELIAQGGFGAIYLASNIAQPQMKAVVKLLWPRLAYWRPELRSIFVEEARLTEEIGQTCWNVVRVSNVRERPWPLFFMEYIRGTTLDSILRGLGSKKVPVDDAKGYLRGLARALAATHAHGRVHRDLKPLNLMVTDSETLSAEERLKVLDFGLSMKIASARTGMPSGSASGIGGASQELVEDHALQSAGTPEYMAPESFDGLHELSGDIYAFGVTAYEILTGESPWPPASRDADRFAYWRDAHKLVPPRPIREARPDVPGWIARLVMQCLEKDPARRVRTATDLITRLKDPLPRWILAVAAAAVLLVAVLGVQAFSKARTTLTPTWILDGTQAPPAKSLELWVRDAGQLSKRTLRAGAGPDKPVTAAWTTSPLATCEVQDGSAVVVFGDDPSLSDLLGRSFAVHARGGDFRLEGEVRVGLDAVAPTLGALRIIDAAGKTLRTLAAAEAGTGLRLGTGADLAIEIDEEHVGAVDLTGEAVRGAVPDTSPIRGERLAGQGSGAWRFPLSGLSAGEHRRRVRAVDQAGNESVSPDLAFVLDRGVSPSLLGESDRPLAGGKAFWEVALDEPMVSLRVLEEGSSRALPAAVLDAAKRPSPEERRDLELDAAGVDAGRLDPGGRYLIAVAAGEKGGAGLLLEAVNAALPPNRRTFPLRWTVPPPLGRDDVKAITLSLPAPAPDIPVSVADGRASRPLASGRIERLAVEGSVDRLDRAKVSFRGVTRQARRSGGGFTLEGVDLETDPARDRVENVLLLTLEDVLCRPLPLELRIETDSRPPSFSVHARVEDRTDPEDLRVASWSGAEIWIDAEEPLDGAVCQVQSRVVVGTLEGDGGSRWRFDLGEAPCSEGRHELRFTARDLAGNESKSTARLVVNTGPPQVLPRPDDLDDGFLVLNGDLFTFEVVDGNELDYASAFVRVTRAPGEKDLEVPISQPKEKGSRSHTVRLRELEEECSGTLTVEIRDVHGLEATDATWKLHFRPLRPSWVEEVADHEGLAWVLVPARPPIRKDLYVTRTEVPIGVYRRAVLSGQVGTPRYWGAGGVPPTYRRRGSMVSADGFPVVGILPKDAEAFAAGLGARLPTYDEWRAAAWKHNPSEPYPWKSGEDARRLANCYGSWDDPDSPFREKRCDRKVRTPAGLEVECYAVEVDADPFAGLPPDLRAKISYPGDILHLIGNVGEIVVVSKGAPEEKGSWGVAGGDFDTNYESISLRDPVPGRIYSGPDARTGFRLVLDPETAPEAFRKKALSVQKP